MGQAHLEGKACSWLRPAADDSGPAREDETRCVCVVAAGLDRRTGRLCPSLGERADSRPHARLGRCVALVSLTVLSVTV